MNQMLRRRCALGVVWVSVVAAMAGFVLPWAKVHVTTKKFTDPLAHIAQGAGLADQVGKRLSRVTVTLKKGTKTISGAMPDFAKMPTQIRGFEVPLMTNRQDTHVAIAVAELLTGEDDLGAKSWLVYLLPGFALAAGLLLTWGVSMPWLGWCLGGIGLSVGGFGLWKLLTASTDMLVVAVTIGAGLWLSFAAYASLGLSALCLAWLARRAAS